MRLRHDHALDRQPGVGCLQLHGADGAWVDAPFDPDALTVNIGDPLARWTGGRCARRRIACCHRAWRPPDEELLSLVYFVESNVDARIEPFPPPIGGGEQHEPVSGGEWLRRRMEVITV